MEDYNKEYYWEFYLRDNPLTKDNTKDCIAEVKTGPKTLTKEDTAREIKRTGSELKLPTILSVTSQDSDIILEALLNGDSVTTDLCQFSPRILGAFENSDAQFDP
ncbi:DNA-binding domain-containing protein, partial [Parabacteroides goldsteinii]